MRKPRILVLSQVYVPDPTAVGQYMADAAEGLVDLGFDVLVLTSARGYDDATVKYPAEETRNGVCIRRMPLSSFGKRNIPIRLLGQSLFLLQVIVRGIFLRRLDCVLVSTSPPMGSIAALAIGIFRRVPIKFWVMDINPDQVIAMGKITARSIAARSFNALNRMILKRASEVIVLDRFMAASLNRKFDVREKLHVIPPWPLLPIPQPVPDATNPFVIEHRLAGKLCVMFSGNHSIANPLSTLLEAALRLQDHPRLHFMFIGGGIGKQPIDDAISRIRPANITSLPYLPMAELKYSLSAADVHVVSLGNDMVGIIHPCKIYDAMSLGRPLLLLGPRPSYIADIVDDYQAGWQVDHGDIDGMVRKLLEIADLPERALAAYGSRCLTAVRESYSKQVLRGDFYRVMLRGLPETGRDPRPQPTRFDPVKAGRND